MPDSVQGFLSIYLSIYLYLYLYLYLYIYIHLFMSRSSDGICLGLGLGGPAQPVLQATPLEPPGEEPLGEPRMHQENHRVSEIGRKTYFLDFGSFLQWQSCR